jgi:OmpA-OmpF porin, OOP family
MLVLAGAAATSVISLASVLANGPEFIAEIEANAAKARDAAGGAGITMSFTLPEGRLTRHPQLDGGELLPPEVRASAAAAIANTPGVGGVGWVPNPNRMVSVNGRAIKPSPLHCQDKVEGILRVRSIRFNEASAAIDPGSNAVLDEVATTLSPCVGSIIAITGHTDAMGDEAANIRLSHDRARAIRAALIDRGIPADGLRARGEGSRKPVEGLDPGDAANRRIEFSVISTRPLDPTPVDTPDAG